MKERWKVEKQKRKVVKGMWKGVKERLKVVVWKVALLTSVQEEYGVPCQYGLYFAMGLALSMEVTPSHAP